MRKNISLFAAFFGLVVFSSCSSDSNETVENPKFVDFTINVETPDAGTRVFTDITDLDKWESADVIWETGDKLSVFCNGFNNNNEFSLKHIDKNNSGDPSNKAAFKGSIDYGAVKFTAIYPYLSNNQRGTNDYLLVDIPATQSPRVNTFDRYAAIQAGVATIKTVDVSLKFQCAFLKVKLPAGWQSFEIACPEGIVGTLNLESLDDGITVRGLTNSSKTVTITPNGTAEAGYYLVTVAPGTYSAMTMKATLADGTVKNGTIQEYSLAKGFCYDLGEVK